MLVTVGSKQYRTVSVKIPPHDDVTNNNLKVFGYNNLAETTKLMSTHSEPYVTVVGDWEMDFSTDNGYNKMLSASHQSTELIATYQ